MVFEERSNSLNLKKDQKLPVDSKTAALLDRLSQFADPMITGGVVRDWLLGNVSKDLDVEVFGCSWESLVEILKSLGRVDLVGKSFGVAKFHGANCEIDFSLPRAEVKTDRGHRGFEVKTDPDLSPERAALRRDFTINSISYDWKKQQFFDPLKGLADLEARTLRHCSSSFSEDPLRALRGFQFCGRFQLRPTEETVELCRSISGAYAELPKERVWMEWEKWAIRSTMPSLGLKFLHLTGWLQHFPEVAALLNCPQDPLWHPEGDVFAHTCHCMDALVINEKFAKGDRYEKLSLSFAVLGHDFGKPETTIQKEKGDTVFWVSPGHDQVAVPLADSFLSSIGAPHSLIARVQALVGNHMAAIQIQKRPSLPQVRRLARRLAPATLNELFTLIRADQAGRPPMSAEPSPGLLLLEEVAAEDALLKQAPKPLVLGRHLIEKGLKPGPHFKPILNEIFELQLDGAFSSLEEAEPFIIRFYDNPFTK
ncbi:MAG: polynucleotide adenylyltransferase [Opitutaceae bacterium]|nr:polynucleotide adenylyltransferase [Opitutaceae bacterium]